MSEAFEFADGQNWFVVTEPSAGVYAIREPLHDEDVRSYLVTGSDRALLIDTGMGVGDIRTIAEGITDLPVTVVNSHSHWDHIGGNWQFDEIAIHEDEAQWLDAPILPGKLRQACTPDRLLGPLPPGVTHEDLTIPASHATRLLHGGETFELGGRTIEAMHLPGHAEGLLAFLDRGAGVLLSTDVVYPGPLYAQSEDCDLPAYLRSLSLLTDLAPFLQHVHPSHNGDDMPPDMIPRMRDGMAAVMAGRQPDEVDAWQATHRFEGFGICVPPGYAGIPSA